MKNLENLGVQELSLSEVKSIDGGKYVLSGWFKLVKLAVDVLKTAYEHGPDYSGNMRVIP